jgi:hypothetical protein
LFLLAGVTSVGVFGISIQGRDYDILAGFWFGPLALLAAPGLVVATVIGLWKWRYRPAFLLALSPLVVVIVGLVDSRFATSSTETVMDGAMIVWGAVQIAVSGWWFAKGRERFKKKYGMQ